MSERMSVEDFRDLARMGAIGPDDGLVCYVTIADDGKETETPIDHPRDIPPNAIAVVYYSK
jgi:hypothetical protein